VSRRRSSAARRKKTTGAAKAPASTPRGVGPTPAATKAPQRPTAASPGQPQTPPRPWVPWFLAAAAYAGFVVSLYLTFVHYRGYVSPCYVVQGCETVQTSSYSVIMGVPLALVGAVGFGVLFYLAIGLLVSPGITLVRVFKLLAFLGALAMIPLFFLQAIVLRAFCSYCVVTEAIMLSIWIVSFLLASAGQSREPSATSAPAGR
jgi:uncharacterized membrane protein